MELGYCVVLQWIRELWMTAVAAASVYQGTVHCHFVRQEIH